MTQHAKIKYENWGTIPYQDAWNRQEEYFQQAIQDKANSRLPANTLILCEHPHVLTLGKHGNETNLLFSKQILQDKGVQLFRTNRGGDITYHGPGQIVGYPIFDLEQFNLGLKQYIFLMEEVIIRFLERHNLIADRMEGATGVWIDKDKPTARKICAIGVRSSRYITMHGFALNINTDLSYFQLINPCGFIDKGVTSVEKEIGKPLNISQCQAELKELFTESFS